jgi:multidrug transporter EmrE-like cation transporter
VSRVSSLALATVAHVTGQFCLSAALNQQKRPHEQAWRAAVELRRKAALVSIILKAPLFLLEIEVVGSSLVSVGAFFSHISSTALLALTISCVLGVLVSVSHFIVMSDTSVLAYQVLAPLKFALTSVVGVVLFGDVLPPHKLLGVIAVLIGLAVFSTHRAR